MPRPDRPTEAKAGTAREKSAALRRAHEARERRRSRLTYLAVAAVVVVVAGVVTFAVLRERANQPSLAGVKTYTVERGHTASAVSYAQTPPVGGEHDPVWLNCGVYASPVRNENAVHAMEHGAVWVTYRPDLPAADVATLKADLPDTYIVLSPYPGLPAPVVASAWGKQLALTGTDDPRLAAFVKAYRQGPQTPEPGAACTGGTDGSSGTGQTPSGPGVAP
ncbi:MAG: DUF3105 domain-containing protein [Actinomycetota bacterium]|nr:DUF3105 domain-containing protein [Actinomycetota bacterium]